jgi:hypothetical protein
MTMRYAHLATNDLDGCDVVQETPRGEGLSGGESSVFASPLTTPSMAAPKQKGEAAAAKPAKAPRKSSKAK